FLSAAIVRRRRRGALDRAARLYLALFVWLALQVQLSREAFAALGEYIHPDHLGSTRLLRDGAGQETRRQAYTPFGDTASETGTGEIRYEYVGGALDAETGLYYLGARYYAPAIGRFLQPDDLGNPFDPQSLNRYTYARNNPVNFLDPTGQFFGLFLALFSFAANALLSLSPIVSATLRFSGAALEFGARQLLTGFGLFPSELSTGDLLFARFFQITSFADKILNSRIPVNTASEGASSAFFKDRGLVSRTNPAENPERVETTGGGGGFTNLGNRGRIRVRDVDPEDPVRGARTFQATGAEEVSKGVFEITFEGLNPPERLFPLWGFFRALLFGRPDIERFTVTVDFNESKGQIWIHGPAEGAPFPHWPKTPPARDFPATGKSLDVLIRRGEGGRLYEIGEIRTSP
ncbi:MAG: RHS repeat-associated core domain-containing protein, partial [Deltaproteobacteria bacterium]|nr:RHS repeat-associated core domain-containing protein [Deltaproteobacteria bacterium]